jgi:hypothetical protein
MLLASQVVAHHTPPDQIPLSEEAREQFPPFKAKKWALQVLHRFFSRWANPAIVPKDMKAFATFWLDTYAVAVTSATIDYLEASQSGATVTKRVLNLLFLVLAEGAQHAHVFAVLKPNLEKIIGFTFSVLKFTPADEREWASDPEEFLRVRSDCIRAFNDPCSSAKELLTNLVKFRSSTLTPILTFSQHYLDAALADPTSHARAVEKYGALALIEAVSERLLSKKFAKKSAVNVAALLARYVLPDFGSSFGLLRYRACTVVELFGERVHGDMRSSRNFAKLR